MEKKIKEAVCPACDTNEKNENLKIVKCRCKLKKDDIPYCSVICNDHLSQIWIGREEHLCPFCLKLRSNSTRNKMLASGRT